MPKNTDYKNYQFDKKLVDTRPEDDKSDDWANDGNPSAYPEDGSLSNPKTDGRNENPDVDYPGTDEVGPAQDGPVSNQQLVAPSDNNVNELYTDENNGSQLGTPNDVPARDAKGDHPRFVSDSSGASTIHVYPAVGVANVLNRGASDPADNTPNPDYAGAADTRPTSERLIINVSNVFRGRTATIVSDWAQYYGLTISAEGDAIRLTSNPNGEQLANLYERLGNSLFNEYQEFGAE